MVRFRDISGQRFDKLVAIERVPTPVGKKGAFWKFKCDCGNEVIRSIRFTYGHSFHSCGCANKGIDRSNINRPKKCNLHGLSHTRLYRIYNGMKNRCYNPNTEYFSRYGGKGIKICDEWLSDFVTFYTWAINNGYSEDLTIDRIDNDGDYCPENCRWTDAKTQANNSSKIRYISYNGETHTLTEWSRILGLEYHKIASALNYGWSFEDIATGKLHEVGNPIYIEYNGECHNLKEWSKIIGIPYTALTARRRRGWSVEAMLTTPLLKN